MHFSLIWQFFVAKRRHYDKLLFYNGVILSEHGEINDGYLTVSDGIIERIGKGTPPALDDSYRKVDLNHHILSPGFIDTHTHGAWAVQTLWTVPWRRFNRLPHALKARNDFHHADLHVLL